jgi:hypothetical protein
MEKFLKISSVAILMSGRQDNGDIHSNFLAYQSARAVEMATLTSPERKDSISFTTESLGKLERFYKKPVEQRTSGTRNCISHRATSFKEGQRKSLRAGLTSFLTTSEGFTPV